MIEKNFLEVFEDRILPEFTITNKNGMRVSVINSGGAIKNIFVPDKNNSFGDVVAGFVNLQGYQQTGNPYFGALIGRYANRIAGAAFTLNSSNHQLSANQNGNTLHGGHKGFDKVYWHIKPLHNENSLKLSYASRDDEEGFPGTLNVKVLYSFSGNNEMTIDYFTTIDKPTPVSFTSHCYFNPHCS